MRPAVNDRQLAEVLVECDQDLCVAERVRQDVFVAWIARPVGNRFDIMSSSAKHVRGTAPDTDVKQDLHESAFDECGFDALVANQATGVDQAGPNIVRLEPRVALQNDLCRVTGS